MGFCPGCGLSLDDGAAFCPTCGWRQGGSSETAPPAAPPLGSGLNALLTPADFTLPSAPARKKSRVLRTVPMALLFAAFIVIFPYKHHAPILTRESLLVAGCLVVAALVFFLMTLWLAPGAVVAEDGPAEDQRTARRRGRQRYPLWVPYAVGAFFVLVAYLTRYLH